MRIIQSDSSDDNNQQHEEQCGHTKFVKLLNTILDAATNDDKVKCNKQKGE